MEGLASVVPNLDALFLSPRLVRLFGTFTKLSAPSMYRYGHCGWLLCGWNIRPEIQRLLVVWQVPAAVADRPGKDSRCWGDSEPHLLGESRQLQPVRQPWMCTASGKVKRQQYRASDLIHVQ